MKVHGRSYNIENPSVWGPFNPCSVPCFRVFSNCSGVRQALHWSPVLLIFIITLSVVRVFEKNEGLIEERLLLSCCLYYGSVLRYCKRRVTIVFCLILCLRFHIHPRVVSDIVFTRVCGCIDAGHCQQCREYSALGISRPSTLCFSMRHYGHWTPLHSTLPLYCHCCARKSHDWSVWTTATIKLNQYP